MKEVAKGKKQTKRLLKAKRKAHQNHPRQVESKIVEKVKTIRQEVR
jgi:hypothetical protein